MVFKEKNSFPNKVIISHMLFGFQILCKEIAINFVKAFGDFVNRNKELDFGCNAFYLIFHVMDNFKLYQR